jgi:hypothetical protein
MAGTANDAGHLVGRDACRVAHNGLASFRGVIWFDGGGVAVVEAPG